MSEFKNLPSGWKVVKLEKVAPLQRGYDLPTDNIKEGLYPVVYSNGILRFHNEFKAKGPGVITGRSGTIGKVVYVEEDYWPHNTSLWVTNFYDNNPKFIYYMYINLNLARFSAGSGVPTLNRNDIHAQTIPLPPLDEQEKIAEILSTWDEAINLTINLIESKKQFKKALMQNLLTAKIRFLQFKDEWKIIRLKKISSRVTRRNQDNRCQNVLTISAQFGLINQTDFFNKQVASKDLSNYILLKKGEFAYNKSYSTGYSFGAFKRLKFYDEGVASPLYIYFKFNDDVCSDFFEFYFDAGQANRQIKDIVQEGARNHGLLNLSIDDFFNIKIRMPNLDEQQKIAEVLTACDDEINLLNLKLENLKKQKQGLMQKLLSGKVRTK